MATQNDPASSSPPTQALHKALGAKQGGDWASAQAALRSNLAHAPKLAALQELLLEAGIGSEPGAKGGAEEEDDDGSGAGHRVLIFAQLKVGVQLWLPCRPRCSLLSLRPCLCPTLTLPLNLLLPGHAGPGGELGAGAPRRLLAPH